jgi:LacI family transcriptional regulator
MARHQQTRRPSIRDVARAAGVSATTVSFVLNDVPDAHIGAATRQRVLSVVERLGYRPNELARGLRRAKTDTIGFLWTDASGVAGGIVEGAQEAAWAAGSLLLLAGSHGDAVLAADVGAALVDRRVDGLLVATRDHASIAVPDPMRSLPTVLVGCEGTGASTPAVVPHHASAGLVATERLLTSGCRRVAFLATDRTRATRLRLAGYRRALENRGLGYEPALIRDCPGRLDAGYDLIRRLIAGRGRPDGLLCGSGEVAAGAHGAAIEAGLRVPADVAVVAFEEPDAGVRALGTALATMVLPHHAMGRVAAETLLQVMQGRSVAHKPLRVPYACHPAESRPAA